MQYDWTSWGCIKENISYGTVEIKEYNKIVREDTRICNSKKYQKERKKMREEVYLYKEE